MAGNNGNADRDEVALKVYSVGQVARETGLTPHTLRVWERRYRRPLPARSASGHRRYSEDQLRLLRRVAEGVAGGLRPGLLLRATPGQLDGLLAGSRPAECGESFAELPDWLRHVRNLDGDALAVALRDQAIRRGPLEFLEDRVAPLLREVGRGWAEGSLAVRHEHLCGQVVEDVLRDLRRRIERHVELWRGTMTLATLPGERHGLGLLMAAIVCATRGVRCRSLGVEIPRSQLLAAARESDTDALGVSVSLATAGVDSNRAVAALRAALPSDLPLVVGGAGTCRVRRGHNGVRYFATLRDFDRWLGTEFSRRPAVS